MNGEAPHIFTMNEYDPRGQEMAMRIVVIRLKTLLFYGMIGILVLLNILSLTMLTRRAFAEGEDAVQVPILMYHMIRKDPSVQGKYTVSPEELEGDLAYLKEHGFETVDIGDLIDYVDYGTPLPDRPVMITFDDGFLDNHVYGTPLLEKYDMKAVINVVGVTTQQFSDQVDENPAYAYLSWNNLKEMQATGRWEIQNHTYDLHKNADGRNGAKWMKGETETHYRSIIEPDLIKLQQALTDNVGVTPTCVAYPYGAMSSGMDEILKEMGFRATLSCYEGIQEINRDPECLYHMKRILRPHGESSEAFFSKALQGLETQTEGAQE